MEYAKEWESCSGVQFIRLASNSYTTPDVIVDVEILENIEDKISWSYLGTDNRDVADEGNTSVKLILKSGELYTQNFKANVLMHFGHVLGLVYEYQRATSMLGLIAVDRNALGNLVERFTQGLSGSELDGVEEIDYSSNSASKFVIKDEDGNTLDYSFDAKSIMLPYLGAGIITYSATGKDVITQANTTLSAQDKAYIAGVYPPMNGDAYTRGATSAIRLTISLPDHTFSDYAVAPYNFDTQTMGELGTSTVASYPTIGVGEYEWTASNLKYMYRTDKNARQLNYNSVEISEYLSTNASGLSTSVANKVFYDVYGSTITSIDGALAYRIPEKLKFERISGYNSETDFALPTRADILQMIGQMPRVSDSYLTNALNFLVGTPSHYVDNITKPSALKYFGYANVSGMSMPLVGEQNFEGSRVLVGRAFSWILGSQNNCDRFAVSLDFGSHFNSNSPKGTSVRYCRRISDLDLGYTLVWNRSLDVVMVKNAGYQPKEFEEELRTGTLRGVALRYLNKKDPKDIATWKVTRKYSELKAEATQIESQITQY